ncbi:stromal cell protein-like [Oopsacas minuta]|uniref:Sugar transporter SWEET1 n=1 Tax=Oopsacas minuta TaxID=111878 RepID=A0AAV7JK02_9METZ|nr:stromal cell protein-like [Oopsacas minuta]
MDLAQSLTFVNFVGTLAIVFTVAVFLSGIEVCQEIRQKYGVDNISFFPFLAIFLNCSLWLLYGRLVGDNFIIGVNIIGAVLSGSYLIFYFQYALGTQKTWFILVVGFGLIMLIAKIWFALYYIQDADHRKQVSSLYCFASTVMMFGSPLVSAYRVIQNKTTEGMSFTLTVTSLGCSSLWTVYGMMLGDSTVEVFI